MTLPLLWLSAAFFCGLVAGDGLGWNWGLWAGAALAGLMAWAGLRFGVAPRLWAGRSSWLVRLAVGGPPLGVAPLLLIVALALGGLRYQLGQPQIDEQHVAWYNGQGGVVLQGIVDEQPQVGDQSIVLNVQARQISLASASGVVSAPQTISGLVRVTLRPGQDLVYGDSIQLTGELTSVKQELNPGWEGSLIRQGILSRMDYPGLRRLGSGQGNPAQAALIKIRQSGLVVLERIFPPPESDLLGGILLGDDSGMPVALQAAYKRTGTAHIIAISGQI